MGSTNVPELPTGRGRLVALAVAGDELSVSVKTVRRRIADGTVTGYRGQHDLRRVAYRSPSSLPRNRGGRR